MDISDGFAGDLMKLLKASGVGATSRFEDLPLSDAAYAALALEPALLRTILTGGDDYEILLTCAPGDFTALAEAANASGTTLTHIGDVTEGHGLALFAADGAALDLGAGRFEHF